jgi:hypothetical protein
MTDDITPTRLYRIFLLNTDVQKRQDDFLVAENIRIGPSGVLECDRVWSDTNIKTKIFYNGEFHITEMDAEEIADFKDTDCLHGEDDDE